MSSKRIMVPLDGSSLAEAVLPWAARLAATMDAEIIVFRASEAHILPGINHAESEVRALEAAQEYLNQIVAKLKAAGLKAWPLTAYGKPGDHIAEAAIGHAATMIAMSTHGRSELGRLIFGSVADKVVRTSTVPVLLVRGLVPAPERLGRLLVPLDGSRLAEQALPSAVTFARATNMEIVLLRVVMPRLTAVAGETLTYTTEYIDDEKDEAWRYLGEKAKHLREQGLVVTTAAEVGRSGESSGAYNGNGTPGGVITAYVKDNAIDIILMCSHCRGGISRFFLGSVANNALRTSTVPVLLLHPGMGDIAATEASGKTAWPV